VLNRVLATIAALTACVFASAASLPAREPYADPRLLDMPWGNYSFIRQAWRGYAETLPAVTYLNGLGVVWNGTPPGKSAAQVAETLAWAGFRRVRLEIPWGAVRWDEKGFDDGTERRLRDLLPALRSHGLRPLILLNANDGQPCPERPRSITVSETATAGDRTLTLERSLPGGLGGFPVTVPSLAGAGSAAPLVESYREEGAGAVIKLSKPLPRSVRAGEQMQLVILKYAPLFATGTPQFERTAQGWLTYVRLVAQYMALLYGSDDYDVEIWNELTFGSAFLDVRNYTGDWSDRNSRAQFLHPGDQAWELANRTTRVLKAERPVVKVVWGFSNTTWFHTPISELPPGIDGQSYHPYGTGKRCYAELTRGRLDRLLDGFVPAGCSIQPEGYAHTWQQTESLMRLIAPTVRMTKPPQTPAFFHYITEDGFAPVENEIRDARGARLAKRKFLLRAPLFWLNKGISALYIYCAFDNSDLGFALFDADGSVSPALFALHAFTARFASAVPLDRARQLGVSLQPLGADPGVLPGDPAGRHLRRSQVVALLPFQLDARRFAIGAYVMTQDFPRDLPPVPYRITISGIESAGAHLTLYIPDTDRAEAVKPSARTADAVSIEVALTDVPRLIEITDGTAT
jgi:hypothetical protein